MTWGRRGGIEGVLNGTECGGGGVYAVIAQERKRMPRTAEVYT